jgi:hypothetical protein
MHYYYYHYHYYYYTYYHYHYYYYYYYYYHYYYYYYHYHYYTSTTTTTTTTTLLLHLLPLLLLATTVADHSNIRAVLCCAVLCCVCAGAMYSFPRIHVPDNFIAYCASIGKHPDVQVTHTWQPLSLSLSLCPCLFIYLSLTLCYVGVCVVCAQYCLELLDETGLSCVPGSGFKQREGTFHIRTTILPQEAQFADIMARFTSFHKGFMRYVGWE